VNAAKVPLLTYQSGLAASKVTLFQHKMSLTALRIIFAACQPILAVGGRIALTLRLIGGLMTAEIARAFPVPEKTLGQRIFRVKRTLSEAMFHSRFRVETSCAAGFSPHSRWPT